VRLGRCVSALISLGALAWMLAQTPSAAVLGDVPVGPGSLSGIWVKSTEHFGDVDDAAMYEPREQVLKTADGSPLPIRPWAAAVLEKRLAETEAGHPFASPKSQCVPGGVPDMMFGSGPMQILETSGQITILRQEFSFFRIIRLNASHEKDPAPSYMGDSVAHWEGDTLVVDTIGLTDKTTLREIIPHSEELHVIERYRRTGQDSMEIRGTIEDPKTFTRTWKLETQLRRLKNGLTEYYCENNRNAVDASGHVGNGVVPQGH
jgi:hypothetical protein